MTRLAPASVAFALTVLGCSESAVQTNDSAAPDASHDAGSADAIVWNGLELGTWDGQFRPLAASGNAFELVAGPQGGYHLDIAAAFDRADVDGLVITLEAVELPSGSTVSVPLARRLDSTRVQKLGASWVWTGDRVIFESVNPAEILGLDVAIRARATQGELFAEAEARGVVTAP